MPKRRVRLMHRRQRSILTDMLPFEVPPTFSNRGFYKFVREHNIFIDKGHVHWLCNDASLDKIIGLIFGIKNLSGISTAPVKDWGMNKNRRSISLSACQMDTIPFNFSVAHKTEGRVLTVVHPRNQIDVAAFYAKHSALITYYCSISEYSIRRPVSVSQFAYFKDKLHDQKLDLNGKGIEEHDREYEQLGSYFVYKDFRNIHKFFESYKYHRCEKKYDLMIQIDINKCFDSIYTHTLPWAVLGKAQTKHDLEESKSTFGGRFDALMQNLNYKETNGIVIGPEFSRIFAEIILQSCDVKFRNKMEAHDLHHRVDYEAFRYVDDYFIFINAGTSQELIVDTLQSVLKEMKLSFNSAKLKIYEKPIITEITRAKERISALISDGIVPEIEDKEIVGEAEPIKKFVCSVNANRMIVRYKTAIKESAVTYGDLLNYSLAIVESRVEKVLKTYIRSSRSSSDAQRLLKCVMEMVEFSFFIYAASPKVNHTIRICRIITSLVSFLNENAFAHELKHLLFKYVHDNVNQQLEKNVMSTHREVESLYLLICLSQIGREYWLPQTTLAKHFALKYNYLTDIYSREGYMSHFSITVLLSYMKDKSRYNKLRIFVQNHAIEKLKYIKVHCPNDAESLILLLDLISCPHVDQSTKVKLADIWDIGTADLNEIQSVNSHWFTAWGPNFNLEKELDGKRSREVY